MTRAETGRKKTSETVTAETIMSAVIVMRSLISEASASLPASKKRQVEKDAVAIEQTVWFQRGWSAGEASILKSLARNNQVANEFVEQFQTGQTLADGASNRNLLIRIVQINAALRQYAKPRRGRGRPRGPNTVSGPDLFVLVEALSGSNPGSYASIRSVAARYMNAGMLPKSTTLEGHVKRIQRRLAEAMALSDK